MVKRGGRLKRKMRGRRKLQSVGYWRVPKTGQIPPEAVLVRMKLRPLDIERYARTKNGGK